MQNRSTKPQLLAFLICEKILIDQDKIPTLIRVIDVFTFTFVAKPEEQKEILSSGVVLECTVFTKWSPVLGDFTEELRLVNPAGTEAKEVSRISFSLPGTFLFKQNRRDIKMRIPKAGDYAFRVYLENELVAEHPFKVNVQVIEQK